MTDLVRLIALRYLVQGRKKGTFSFISIVSITGLALGVAALIIVLSVMDGFLVEMRKTVLSSTSHANVYKLTGSFENHEKLAADIKSIDGVKGAQPLVFNEVLVTSGREIAGAILNGVSSKEYSEISNIPNTIKSGSFDGLDPEKKGTDSEKNDHAKAVADFLEEDYKIFPVVIGSDMSKKLKVKVDSVITLVSSKGKSSDEEGIVPVSRNFKVVGIFDTGLHDYDSRFIYTDIKAAQSFLNTGDKVSFISVRVNDINELEKIKGNITTVTGGFPYAVQDWEEMHRTTFKFLRLQKIVMFIILGFIILVASFGIITTLIMLVISKKREISVLRSLGVKRSTVSSIFIFDGLIVGMSGTIIGALLAAAGCLFLRTIEFPLSKEVYFFSSLPVEMSVGTFVSVMAASMIISMIATLYPSIKASGITPIEGLRYE